MFETLETPSVWPFVRRYFAQLIFCYPAVMLAGLPVSLFLSLIGLSGDHPAHVHFAGYQALQCLFVGAFVGWNIALRGGSSFVSSGRWIWVLPAVVTAPIIFSEEYGFQPVKWLPEYISRLTTMRGWVFIS